MLFLFSPEAGADCSSNETEKKSVLLKLLDDGP